MNVRPSVPMCLLLLAGCAGASDEEVAYFPNAGVYEASPDQERVDRSFSDISIETPFDQVQPRLTEIRGNGCEEWGECEWRDADGVRHYFFDGLLVVKTIHPDEFANRRIPALGIGAARKRDQVLVAARKFLPDADFDCDESDDNTGSCDAYLRPGWVTLRFDPSGSLTQVKLDGYHFT